MRTTAEYEHHLTGLDLAKAWARFLAFWIAMAAVVTETLLALRMGLLAGEANAGNGFVEFIYDVTGPLIQPFEGIMAVRTVDNGGIFEPATAFAMAVYLAAALLLIAAIWWGAVMAPVPHEEEDAVHKGPRVHQH